MGKLKEDILRAMSRGFLIVALAGVSELVSQGVQYISGHQLSTFVDKSLVMAALGFFQKFLTAQLRKEESGL